MAKAKNYEIHIKGPGRSRLVQDVSGKDAVRRVCEEILNAIRVREPAVLYMQDFTTLYVVSEDARDHTSPTFEWLIPQDNRSLNQRISDGDFDNKKPFARPSKDRAVWEAYSEETSRLLELFKAEALEDVGLTFHPKAEKAWSKAWEKGHSNGLSEVLSELRDISDVLYDD